MDASVAAWLQLAAALPLGARPGAWAPWTASTPKWRVLPIMS